MYGVLLFPIFKVLEDTNANKKIHYLPIYLFTFETIYILCMFYN